MSSNKIKNVKENIDILLKEINKLPNFDNRIKQIIEIIKKDYQNKEKEITLLNKKNEDLIKIKDDRITILEKAIQIKENEIEKCQNENNELLKNFSNASDVLSKENKDNNDILNKIRKIVSSKSTAGGNNDYSRINDIRNLLGITLKGGFRKTLKNKIKKITRKNKTIKKNKNIYNI